MKKRLFLPIIIWIVLIIILRIVIHDFGVLYKLRVDGVEKLMESEKYTDKMDKCINAYFDDLNMDIRKTYSEMSDSDREELKDILANHYSLDTAMYLLSVTDASKVIPHIFSKEEREQFLELVDDYL